MAIPSFCIECKGSFLKKDALDKQSHCVRCLRKLSQAQDREKERLLSESRNENQTAPTDEKPKDEKPADDVTKISESVKKPHIETPSSVQLCHEYWDEA